MTALPAPKVRRTAQNSQYTYNLNRRMHDVKTYPVQTWQGATVILYGHDNGLTLLWRGGKHPKRTSLVSGSKKKNGASMDDAVMVLDSDDEASSANQSRFPSAEKPEFEDTPADEDPFSFPEVIQTLDLTFGSAVLQVAVLPLAPTAADNVAWTAADVLKERMVFAVACASSDVYLVTLPLTPPSHGSKLRPELRSDLLAGAAGNGFWGETLTLLGGQTKPSDDLAIALVRPRRPGSDRSRSRDRGSPRGPPQTRVVVASCSREASGALRFWDANAESRSSGLRVEPFQTDYLPCPLQSVSFNPSVSTQLLAVASPHAVRIYDYSLPSLPEDLSEGPFPTQGSWLLSLYPPFLPGTAMSASRKPIVAAAWIAQGRAILTLLADGQWGIWDIDSSSPSAGSGGPASLFGKHSSGLRGTGLTGFSVTGYLEGTSALRNPVSQKSPPVPGSGEFVPMTPATRRSALASISAGADRLAAVSGGIEVVHSEPPGTSTTAGAQDESAVLWMAGADPVVVVIPGIARFWEAQLRRGVGGGVNLFSGSQPTRMIRLMDLGAGLLGERCTGVGAAPRSGGRRHRADDDDSTGKPPGRGNAADGEGLPIDILIRGESRLVVVRESDDGMPITDRLTSRKKPRTGARAVSAIIAYPRPEKPNSVAFNLSVARPGMRYTSQPRPAAAGPFGSATTHALPSTERETSGDGTRPAKSAGFLASAPSHETGLAFSQSLHVAADAVDDEEETGERNVEEEILDIMEIDRELEELESERNSGAKHVFFEEA